MSALVKLSSKLPGDVETNGIDQHAQDLIDDPKAVRIAVVWFDTQKVTTDTDTGDEIPTVRIRRFEPLGIADDVSKSIRAEVQKAIEARTGRTPLPFDVIDVDEQRFSDPLPGVDEDAR